MRGWLVVVLGVVLVLRKRMDENKNKSGMAGGNPLIDACMCR